MAMPILLPAITRYIFYSKHFIGFLRGPFFIGSMTSFYGFIRNYFSKEKLIVSKEFISFYRREQLQKLLKKDFWNLYLVKYKLLKK